MAIDIDYVIPGDPNSDCGTDQCECGQCEQSDSCAAVALYDGFGDPIPTTLYATITCPTCPGMDGAVVTLTHGTSPSPAWRGTLVVCNVPDPGPGDISMSVEVGCTSDFGCLYINIIFAICAIGYEATSDTIIPGNGPITANSYIPVDLTYTGAWDGNDAFCTINSFIVSCCGEGLDGDAITVEITE